MGIFERGSKPDSFYDAVPPGGEYVVDGGIEAFEPYMALGGTAEERQYLQGEDPGIDLTDPYAKHANRKLKSFGDNSDVVVPMGEHGDIAAKDLRLWRSGKPGELIAFIRREAGEHKIITATVALGVVATAIAGVKYLKK
jgi:hypothetical protein